MRGIARRGQALVMFALTLLLIGLMGLITFGIAARVRDRIETQVAADAAAYSQAVTAARTYNMIAVMNRAGIAHWVSLLGGQSLISWSGQQRDTLKQVSRALRFSGCLPGLVYAEAIDEQRRKIAAEWHRRDRAAGESVRNEQRANRSLRDASGEMNQELVGGLLALNDAIAQKVSPDLRSVTGQQKSIDELSAEECRDFVPVAGTGAFCVSYDGDEFRSAIMGSRGYEFVISRKNGPRALARGIERIINAAGLDSLRIAVSASAPRGGAGIGPDPRDEFPDKAGNAAHNAQYKTTMTGTAAWAHDHATSGTIRIDAPGCLPMPFSVENAFVVSSAREFTTDVHCYGGNCNPNSDNGNERGTDQTEHTLDRCATRCPGVFGGMFTYDKTGLGPEQAAQDFGQPKVYAMIERDLRRRAVLTEDKKIPWDLTFRLKFLASGPGAVFDNGGADGTFRGTDPNDQADLSKQVAVGAGLIYYHRPRVGAGGGFQEPPNLFNPFWRATLAAPDCDLDARLGEAGYTEQSKALALLKAKGFRGISACNEGKPR